MSGLSDRVDFRLGKFYEPLTVGEVFEVIVSNPPYVADGEAQDLDPGKPGMGARRLSMLAQTGLLRYEELPPEFGPYLKPGDYSHLR
ncbi:MAG: hypothetical protein Ct9H300mP15_28720 [Gemmatimonadota bacterium]|nr:MAG: hypothetical protein Ct9H300mP15_28720 [Gemmatimonadota bacterium]